MPPRLHIVQSIEHQVEGREEVHVILGVFDVALQQGREEWRGGAAEQQPLWDSSSVVILVDGLAADRSCAAASGTPRPLSPSCVMSIRLRSVPGVP